MIAERLTSIEGRLYLKAKQEGTKIPSNIAELAHQELKKHRAHTQKLADELSQKYALPKDVATNSAKNILRYKEIHGIPPSEPQISNIIQIAQKLVRNQHIHASNKKLNQLEADYLQRHKGDLLFNHMMCQKEIKHDIPFSHIQDQTKKALEIARSQINQELIKMNEKEFSL
ncbi:MAG: hypothetical protein Q8T08_25385 [Ignavibacteria bacterium]|nr:hypothetical protein [Ignavibacteria bacterium]